ncbi:SwmB domain-containing protein [Azospirillum sp. ST 5-10]|uniref:SwmB domain-containing protein n=1 Tax=unclassified Azospirillum TaxID=2630922 RepID=UPI003F4A3F89
MYKVQNGSLQDDLLRYTSSTHVPIDRGDGLSITWTGAGKADIEGGNRGDIIAGGNNDDTVDGGGGEDTIAGGAGADSLSGAVGNDVLRGDAGADTLVGGDGTDTLYGGAGIDLLHGGAGVDQFAGTRAELDGDTVVDIGLDETIRISDALLADLSALDGIAVADTPGLSNGTATLSLGGGATLNLQNLDLLPSTAAWKVASGPDGVTLSAYQPPPAFVGATVVSRSLTMTYDQTLDANHPPSATDFVVVAGGTPMTVAGVAVDSAAKTVTLTLADPVQQGQAVTVAYADPTADDDDHAVQGASGVDAASLTATAVENRTPTIELMNGAANPAIFSNYVGQTFTATGTTLDSATVGLQLPLLPIAADVRVLVAAVSDAAGQINPTTVLYDSGVLSLDLQKLGLQTFDLDIDYDGLTVGSQYALIVDGVVESTPPGLLMFDQADAYAGGMEIRGLHTTGNTRDQDFAADWTEVPGYDLGVRITMSGTPTPTPPNTSPPTSSDPGPSVVDGVAVDTTTTTNPDGSTSHTVVVPVVDPSRAESVGGNTVADIPLVSGGGRAYLAAQVPTGFGLQASGPTGAKAAGGSLDDLIQAIERHTDAGSADQAALTGGGSSFLEGLPADTPLLVQTIVPAMGAGAAPGAVLTISGTGTEAGGPATALVIDARNLPAGTEIALDNVSFAAVIGNVRISGGAGSQVVTGDSQDQHMVLGADDDTLHGGAGNDFVGSEGGADVLHGDLGDDTVTGGADGDLLFGNPGTDALYGNLGADTLFGGQGDDQAFGGQDGDVLHGNLGADALHGNLGTDRLFGNQGDDLLYGNQGGDTLFGGQGDDRLFGGQGDDVLVGNLGDDTLTGGLGADLFRAGEGADVVADFDAAAGDRLDAGGAAWTVRAGDAGAVVDFGSGNTLTLVGVRPAEVADSWFAAA